MISVEEAYNLVLSQSIDKRTRTTVLTEATGRILAEDVHADQDFPPFNRVMMDGIALHSNMLGTEEVPVHGMQTAGAPQQSIREGTAMEVMTGAILPNGADVVIPYELVEIREGSARLLTTDVSPLQNIHLKGTDRKSGDLLIRSGRKIGAPEIAVLATVGKSEIAVAHLDVAVVSTGDELVDIDETPHPYQIRKSNSHMLHTLIRQHGLDATLYHLQDDLDGLTHALGEILEKHSVLILSGGVSRGKKDFVPQALENLNVSKLFHRVAQRPGKPFWFGARESGQVVFALPGNPVSTFLCYLRYVRPWMRKYCGEKLTTHTARLGEDFRFSPDLTCFLQVRLSDSDGYRTAIPVAGRGSGDLANLLDADGFLELPEGRDEFNKGSVFEYIPFRC